MELGAIFHLWSLCCGHEHINNKLSTWIDGNPGSMTQSAAMRHRRRVFTQRPSSSSSALEELNWEFSVRASKVDFDESLTDSGLICSNTPTSSPLAMLFSAKDRKPNLLNLKQTNLKESCPLTTQTGLSGDGRSSRNSTHPLPLAPSDRYYNLNSFSSEDFSFATNPNDVTSITSSDWGDEACEIDRQRSHCVQLLFNAIDQMLFEPGCLKNSNSNDHPNSSSDARKENPNSSTHPAGIDLNSVWNLLPECEEWASRFPHFRLHGIQIRPPPPPQPLSPPLTNQRSSLYQQYLQNRPSRQPRQIFRSPEVNKVSQVKINQQGSTQGQQFGSALVVQGQRIPTPMNATTTWLNRSRVNRSRARFPAGTPNTRAPTDLVNSNRNLLSTLPEETEFERGRKRSKTPLLGRVPSFYQFQLPISQPFPTVVDLLRSVSSYDRL
ncbi:hypothetical protein Aperf_G00000129570 [Anoplocephala perfoliata]